MTLTTHDRPANAHGDDPIVLMMRYLDGELDEGQTRSLDQMIQAKPELGELFTMVCIHRKLLFSRVGPQLTRATGREQWEDEYHQEIMTELLESERLERMRIDLESKHRLAEAESQQRRSTPHPFVEHVALRQIKEIVIPRAAVWGGVAALLVVGVLLVASLMESSPAPGPVGPTAEVIEQSATAEVVVATLIGSEEAQWRRGDEVLSLPVGGLVYNKPIALTHGWARMRFLSGAEVSITAPAYIEPVAANRMKLSQGKLVGYCATPQSRGFTVDTPSSRVVDTGTEFGVIVEGQGVSQCHVFEGHVEVAPVVGGEVIASKNTRLQRGEAIGMMNGEVDRRVALSSELFGKPYLPLVAGFKSKQAIDYQLLPRGFESGVAAFSEKQYTWAELPAPLVGADYLMGNTAVSHRWVVDSEVTLDIARPANIYILQHPGTTSPDWLRKRFELTPHTVQLNGSAANEGAIKLYGEEKNFEYKVWCCEVPVAGSVSIPKMSMQTEAGAWHSIAVVVAPIDSESKLEAERQSD